FVLLNLAELGRIRVHLGEAQKLATASNDQRRQGWISFRLMASLWNVGDYAGTLESGQHALAIAASLGDVALQAQANLQRGHAYYWLGDYRQAVDVFTHNVTSLQGDLRYLRTPHVPAALSFGGLACTFAERGDFVEGIAAGHEAVRIAESV